MSDSKAVTMPTDDAIFDEAIRRYHYDAEFHAEVHRAVSFMVSRLGGDSRTWEFEAITSVAVALVLRDQNGRSRGPS